MYISSSRAAGIVLHRAQLEALQWAPEPRWALVVSGKGEQGPVGAGGAFTGVSGRGSLGGSKLVGEPAIVSP